MISALESQLEVEVEIIAYFLNMKDALLSKPNVTTLCDLRFDNQNFSISDKTTHFQSSSLLVVLTVAFSFRIFGHRTKIYD